MSEVDYPSHPDDCWRCPPLPFVGGIQECSCGKLVWLEEDGGKSEYRLRLRPSISIPLDPAKTLFVEGLGRERIPHVHRRPLETVIPKPKQEEELLPGPSTYDGRWQR